MVAEQTFRDTRARTGAALKLRSWQKDPFAFINENLDVELWSGMKLIVDSVWRNRRTTVRACHGISKTLAAAIIGTTWLNVFPRSVVVTTAPTNRQAKFLLWKEIRGLYQRAGGRLRGACQTMQVRTIDEDTYMIGFATDQPVACEGFHAEALLWILDEGKGLAGWLYDAVEGSMTGGNARVLELSTTDGADQQCPFRKHHSDKKRWKSIHLSAFDSPFVDAQRYPRYRHLMNRELTAWGKPADGREWPAEKERGIPIATEGWIDDRLDEWQQSRPDLVQTKIFGNFASSGQDDIIPLEWVEAAVENPRVQPGKPTVFGLDVAAFGDDENVLFERQYGLVKPAQVWNKKNAMEVVGAVVRITKKRGVIRIDAIGAGHGSWGRLSELGHPVIGLISSERAIHEPKEYYNLRAEMWFHARAVFERNFNERDVLSIPNDPELIEDLTGLKYKIHSDGRMLMERKDEFKKRFGRSPNRGDALVYCLANIPQPIEDEVPEEWRGDFIEMDDEWKALLGAG